MQSKQMVSKVRFPIGAKLIIIVSLISILSLGAITALVSYMVTQDIKITAEDNNMTVNARSAAEAEEMFKNLRAGSDTLLSTLEAADSNDSLNVALAEKAAGYYFANHPDVAAVSSLGIRTVILMNEAFFTANGLTPAMLDAFMQANNNAVRRSLSGETVLVNAAPYFGYPLLALFYTRQGGAALAMVSAQSISETFGTGTSSTFMINDSADILVHPNADLAAAAVNLGNDNFIRSLNESPQPAQQTFYTDDSGVSFLSAFTRLTLANAAVITVIEEAKIFEGIAATTRRNIYLTIAVLCIAGILIWLFSKSISTPMKTLAGAAAQIENGDFDIALRAKSKDEIGVLTSSFQSMSSALGIFGRFVNKDIAVRAMKGEIKPGGLAKEATIFFSDIRGFTEKSENFTKAFGEDASDRIVHWLNLYFTKMVECVEKTKGVVDKFIGDAVMAHWGTSYTDGSPKKDALNCVMAALYMRKALYDMNKDRKPEDTHLPPIKIGCGINSGKVTAGQIGSEQRMEYTVIGDPVNLASRVESLCKPMGADILIAEDTYNLVGEHFITEEMPSVTVKGKVKPVRIFAVINVKSSTSGPKTLAELRKILGIEHKDVTSADVNAEEKKYKIGGEQ